MKLVQLLILALFVCLINATTFKQYWQCLKPLDQCKHVENACIKIPQCFAKLLRYAGCYYTTRVCLEGAGQMAKSMIFQNSNQIFDRYEQLDMECDSTCHLQIDDPLILDIQNCIRSCYNLNSTEVVESVLN